MRIAVIGVGLIGGSIALAARERVGAEIVGHDPDPEAIAIACDRGVLDRAAASLAGALEGADVAVIAAPVGRLAELAPRVLAAAPVGCVVTDVGSTKRQIAGLLDDPRFIGGHPLAGAETAGVVHARSDLFDGATWYLTPAQHTDGILYERLHRLIGALGAHPVAIEPDAHDAVMAAVSHLPHILANVLVAEAAAVLTSQGERLPATGPSFRDATRVAGANSAIWTDIYLANREALLARIDAVSARLAEVRTLLAAGDGVEIGAWNDRAGADRRALVDAQLAGGALTELRVPVPNRPGVVAGLTLELSRAGVNLADLALYPAPDMSEGVVALWVTGAEAADRTEATLRALDFTVYRP
ncbi:prephenate dehydrogenase/arogenate dehydrogenase family protein [Conexibacter sp. DBS9H8]|uniref:prephenate dehydrogenase/arogenate dehydrogenase family protein n=1 Tax=Conexibacter sp. DBS9H8 TaxID=2937801 RepID=UPI00200C0BE7|nr:prephenate dehydrogenase/arogenate dehydrogenase family protein [Conexibacter sp. DBS9H8]